MSRSSEPKPRVPDPQATPDTKAGGVCLDCGGTGQVGPERCETCDGTGRADEDPGQPVN